jgi:hypothetical protein
MHLFSGDDVIDDLRSWGEVEDYLTGPWYEVREPATGLAVSPLSDELLVREPHAGTAKQRRLLHRAGFRRTHTRCWAWTPAEPVLTDPPWRSATPVPHLRAAFDAMQREMAIDRARNGMALHVLRDVYGCAPQGLVVVLAREDDPWGDDWDDDDVEAADCATLEVRYGDPCRR